MQGHIIGFCCYCYHKGTYFQANHNSGFALCKGGFVVIATTKVRIFKQITTFSFHKCYCTKLLLLPQRYVFSSKSQLCPSLYSTRLGCYCYHKGTYFQANHNSKFISGVINPGCYCYHKGTYFQANHNRCGLLQLVRNVVIATTKVRIFKQITTVV